MPETRSNVPTCEVCGAEAPDVEVVDRDVSTVSGRAYVRERRVCIPCWRATETLVEIPEDAGIDGVEELAGAPRPDFCASAREDPEKLRLYGDRGGWIESDAAVDVERMA